MPEQSQRYIPPTGADEKMLVRRVLDAVKTLQHTGNVQFLGFFDDRQQQLASAALQSSQFENYLYSGGLEGAERLMLCVFEDLKQANFPITLLQIEAPSPEKLTHRDYLGSILGTGIKRSCVGDIYPNGTGALVLVQNHIAAFLQEQLTQIGRQDVRVYLASAEEAVPQEQRVIVCSANVPSLRLDAVLSALLHSSRSAAAMLITQGKIQVNHVVVQRTHYTVCEGDVFSVRGQGKYQLKSIGGKSRKNRTFIEYLKYQ